MKRLNIKDYMKISNSFSVYNISSSSGNFGTVQQKLSKYHPPRGALAGMGIVVFTQSRTSILLVFLEPIVLFAQ
jgi:hypothetical protein